MNAADVAEQHDEDRQAYRRLGGSDRQDEEDEDLPRRVVEKMRERDEIHVDREQHELDRHQQHDHVLAIEKNADDGDREQDRGEHEVVRQRYHEAYPSCFFSLGIDTMRTRSARRTLTCWAGS